METTTRGFIIAVAVRIALGIAVGTWMAARPAHADECSTPFGMYITDFVARGPAGDRLDLNAQETV